MSSSPERDRLNSRALLLLLDELAGSEIVRTVVLPAGGTFADSESETGWIVFAADAEDVAIAPPFPLERAGERDGFDPRPLVEQLDRQATVGVILVRLGRYAVGVFRGRELISSKTETRYVGGQHKAGGWSQKRFVRIREKQMRELFDKVCTVSQEKLGLHEESIERLWLGGDRHVLNGFLKRCPWVERLAERTASRRLAVPTPDMKGLKASIDEALSHQVVRLPRGSGAL
jgi:peptide subunit release factor 1 (eRF1)